MLVIPLAGGCASMGPRMPIGEVAKQQSDRKTQIVQSFEKKRDVAQFEAAMVRWREGDAEGCQELVDKLLARSPKHRGGRLLRAESRLVEEKPELAIADLQALVAEEANDPEAAHLLGLLLEAAERHEEALPYFEKAVQLSPGNTVFAASYQTALVGETEGPPRQPGADTARPIGNR